MLLIKHDRCYLNVSTWKDDFLLHSGEVIKGWVQRDVTGAIRWKSWTLLVVQMVKISPAMWETQV